VTIPSIPSERRADRGAGSALSGFGLGFLLGGAVALLKVVTLMALLMSNRNSGNFAGCSPEALSCNAATSFDQHYLNWLSIAILSAGYISAIVLTVRGSTRRRAIGMLIGLTVVLPVAAVAAFLTWGVDTAAG
jgi:hypothetical protein